MSNLFFDEGDPACGQKVLLATPSYDAPAASYTFSIARSREALHKAGIQSAYLLLQGHCHVDDSRNAIVRNFLESDCTELVFIDADVDWEPKSLVQLCQRDKDIVGGVYPFRRDNADQMPVRMLGGAVIDPEGLMEVEGLPTGFMKIKRSVLERMAKTAPKFFDKINETALIFDRPTPGEDKVRWGGDIAFCNRWREMGGKLYADAEIRLGHKATIILRDSLASHLRRITGKTLSELAPKFVDGTETENDYNEIFKYAMNPYAADAGGLAMVVGIARKCRGSIIETGSGLSSVLMALASGEKIYSLEHIDHYAKQTHVWAEEAGVNGNLGICYAPLKDYWYDLDQFDLPNKFAFGFCDGPPRLYGTRMQFFEKLAPRCTLIAVDDVTSDPSFARKVSEWAQAKNRSFEIVGRCAMLQKIELKAAA